MIDRLLQIHLEPIDRDHRRWRLLRALSFGWLTAAALGLLFILVRYSTGWTSPWVFLLLLLGALGWTVVAWRQSTRGASSGGSSS